jgi:hypothetical protein
VKLRKKVELDNVGSVQFTETDYNFSKGFEYDIKSGGITLKKQVS